MFGLCAIYTIVAISLSYSDTHYAISCFSTFPAFELAAAIFCLLGANADHPEVHMVIHFILVRIYVCHISCSNSHSLTLDYFANLSLWYGGSLHFRCYGISILLVRVSRRNSSTSSSTCRATSYNYWWSMCIFWCSLSKIVGGTKYRRIGTAPE